MIDANDVKHVDAVDLASEDPRLATLSEMDRSLTPSRRKIANEILSQLNSPDQKTLRHHMLLVGPAGSGKTRIMKYLQTILNQFQESTIVMVIQEETRSILSLFDFIVTCLRYYDAVSSDQLVATLQSTEPDPLTAVIELFDKHTDGRKTAIFIEDFSDLFHNMTDADRDAMQTFFSERKHITVVASSVSTIVEKRTTLGTLSNLFSVRHLPELSADETSVFLGRLLMNQKHLPPLETSAMMVLHHVAGGNQHLMEQSGRLLDEKEWPDIALVLPELIDRVFTPYFRKRIHKLNATQRFVLGAIALHSGEALSEERLASLVKSNPEILSRTLGELKAGRYIDQTRIGQLSYFDIHEPFLRILLERDDDARDEIRTLILLTAHWLEAERRAEFELVPKPVIAEDELEKAVHLAESGDTNAALESLSAILERDPQNPTAAAQAFKLHLQRKREDALGFLERVANKPGLSLRDSLRVITQIDELVKPDLELRSQMYSVWTNPRSVLPQSIIYTFLEQRDDDRGRLEQSLLPLLGELAPESRVFALLNDLVRRYLHRESVPEQSLLHIPVELRTLITKHAGKANQLYTR